ncbi:GNAT family N-acetyltransferase [Pyramidobacter piscolens]|uniref:GNAT family N-acetyltransferase n=1 Tax=Pyramidobacter piscolens TaxID=638849 RepID=UPI0026E09C90|nr:GNAT family N-acetyltransferase [Pyramidobacter piscolens]
MKYFRKTTLRNGSLCVLRSAAAEDATALLEQRRCAAVETDFMLRYSDEIAVDVEPQRRSIEASEVSPTELLLIAEVDGVLTASAGFAPPVPCEKCRHRASAGLCVLRASWGWGIGSLLMESLLECARAAQFEQLELDVVTGNERAVAMYQRFGFVTYGVREKAFCLRGGGYQSLYLMALEL